MTTNLSNIELGANLVIAAIDENLPAYFKNTETTELAAERAKANKAMQALSLWQRSHDILTLEKVTIEGSDETINRYGINVEAMSKLTEKDIVKGDKLYMKAVETQMDLITNMYNVGKTDYVENFAAHRPIQHLFETPEPRYTEDSLDAVAKRALALTEAAHNNPDIYNSIKGLNRADMENLTNALANANYLVAGENPLRTEPLSDQTARGDYDAKRAIFDAAEIIASNITVPRSTKGLDMEMVSANGLKDAVSSVETEEYRLGMYSSKVTRLTPFNSDLQNDDIIKLGTFIANATRLQANGMLSLDEEDYDHENPMIEIKGRSAYQKTDGSIVAKKDIVQSLGVAILDLKEDNIIDVIKNGASGRGTFHIPGLVAEHQERQLASDLNNLIKVTAKIATYAQNQDEIISGDAGSLATDRPELTANLDKADASLGGGDEFDKEVDLEQEPQEEEIITSGSKNEHLDWMDDKNRKIPGALMDQQAAILANLMSYNIFEKFNEITKFPFKPADEMQISHADYEDYARNASESTKDGADRTMNRNVYTTAQVRDMGIEGEASLRKQDAIFMADKNGPLAKLGYKSSPVRGSKGEERFSNFVAKEMTGENANVLKSILRRTTSSTPIVATSTQEGLALVREAEKFREREAQEYKLRKEKIQEKMGTYQIDIPLDALSRVVNVAQASQGYHNDAHPLRVNIDKDGSAMIGRSDTPAISSKTRGDLPATIATGAKNRQMGGGISISAARAALESAREGDSIVLVMAGEVPVGMVSKSQESAQRVAQQNKDRAPKGLPGPDVLG